MTDYLLDTDICIYWLKGSQVVKDHLLNAGTEHIAISVITAAELYFGAYNSVRVKENHFHLERFLDTITILPLENYALQTFGVLKAELRKEGQALADFDLLIAATALAEGRVLVTNNIRHYERIPHIRLENWVEV
ncbi:MAG: PIN domain-containing protein [Anaerolineales bacterium]|nr:PIN domain-containing protein [Anaerolineales bacterium]